MDGTLIVSQTYLITKAVHDAPGLNTQAIAEATGLSVVAVDLHGAEMERAGIVYREGSSGGYEKWFPGKKSA